MFTINRRRIMLYDPQNECFIRVARDGKKTYVSAKKIHELNSEEITHLHHLETCNIKGFVELFYTGGQVDWYTYEELCVLARAEGFTITSDTEEYSGDEIVTFEKEGKAIIFNIDEHTLYLNEF